MLKSRCYYLESNRPVAFHQSGLSCCQSFPYIFLFRLKLNQLLWRLSYLSSCLAKRLQAFWISGRPTNPSHFLASYRLHQARVGLPYEAFVTFIICFFYWFFQLRLPNLHSRYKAENSTLIYLGRSIRWQKEEANRNLLSIHLKITLLLLLLTPIDFLLLCLLCLLCLCLLRHCSLCVRPVIIPELIANDVRLLLSLFFNTQPRTNNCSLSFESVHCHLTGWDFQQHISLCLDIFWGKV